MHKNAKSFSELRQQEIEMGIKICLFRLRKENEAMKIIITKDARNAFKLKKWSS